ncbi:MAG: sensor histidine kinase [Firmicutes bacterium]|jgi:NarL family two-component system sensor histidine kinase LiaS|nr:sensor histidine kinase [Bacillota bacterium]
MFKRLHGQAVLRVGLTGGAAAAVVCAAAIILFHYGGTYRDWLLNPLVWVVLLALGIAAGSVVGLWLEYESSRALRKDLDEIRYGVRVLTEGNLHYRWKEWGVRITDQLRHQLNRMAAQWQDQTRRLQRLADEKEQLVTQAREAGMLAERQRLARELHDAVSQQLFALAMTAAAARRQLHSSPDQVEVSLQRLEDTAKQAQREMRALLLQLRPVELEEEPLASAIESLVSEIEARGLLTCRTELEQNLELSPSTAANLLRIFQEAVTNSLRHARAENLEVRLYQEADVIRLVIVDDGVGFDLKEALNRRVSLGLTAMQERAQECGGQMKIVSVPGWGTRISVQVPRL